MRRALLLVALTFLPKLWGCSCVGLLSSSCERNWNSGETIFLGKVISMEGTEHPAEAFLLTYKARFIVEESLRGSSESKEIEVYTGSGGGDCGYPFVVGGSYLVYAMGNRGHLQASICSETKPAVIAGGVLKELRALKDGKPIDDIFGTFFLAPAGGRYQDQPLSKPLPGVPVRAIGTSGRSFATRTDDHGVYAFASLPAGAYMVESDPPKGLENRPSIKVEGSGSGCRLDRSFRPDGRIEGVVVDAKGKTAAGLVTIQPADPVEAAAARQRGGLPGFDVGPDGRFSLPELPPGRYRLLYHPPLNFGVTYDWPPDPNDAIELSFGQHIVGLQFKLPAKP